MRARRLDEGEVLLGERQDRDAVQVDLLPAGELEQEVERPFEAVDVDVQRRLADRALGELDVLERQATRPSRPTDSFPGSSFRLSGDGCKRGRRSRARASTASNGSGSCAILASAACGPAQRLAGKLGAASAATASISSRLPLQWSTMSQPAANAASRPLRERARQRLHREVVAHHEAVIADMAADRSSRITAWEVVAGLLGIERRVDDVRRHRERHVGKMPERHEILRVRARRASASTTGRSRWLSAAARPCPGMCLMTGSTPPAISPSAAARPRSATVSGSRP